LYFSFCCFFLLTVLRDFVILVSIYLLLIPLVISSIVFSFHGLLSRCLSTLRPVLVRSRPCVTVSVTVVLIVVVLVLVCSIWHA